MAPSELRFPQPRAKQGRYSIRKPEKLAEKNEMGVPPSSSWTTIRTMIRFPDIVLALADDLLVTPFAPELSGRQGWYLGSRYETFYALSRHLSALHFSDEIGKRLNVAANQLTETMVELDAQLGDFDHGAQRRLDWWSSDIAERSPYASALLNIATRLVVFDGIAADGDPALVVVDDPKMLHMLWHRHKGLSWKAPGQKPGLLTRFRWWCDARIRPPLAGIRDRLGNGARLFARMRQIRRLRADFPLQQDLLRQADALLVIWGRKDSFQAQQPLADAPWLGPLPMIYRQAGLKLCFLVNPIWWVDPFSAIARNALESGEPVFFPEECWTWRDVLKAMLRPSNPVASGARLLSPLGDLTDALKLDQASEWLKWRPAHAAMHAAIGPWLARHHIGPKSVAMLYENHGWERALRFGLREGLPETNIVGIQQSAFAPLYLNFLPSRREMTDGIAPDQLVAMGERFARTYREHGFPQDRLFMGGAPRYQAFLATEAARSAAPAETGGGAVALATCGPDPDENLELVLKATLAIRGIEDLRLIVNFHPLTTAAERQSIRDFITQSAPDESHRISWSDASVRTLLNGEPRALLYCDTNASFEGLAAGAQPIQVGRHCGLNYDKLPVGASLQASTIPELHAALKQALSTSPKSKEDRLRTVSQSLGPVDAAAFLAAIRASRPTP